MFSVWAVDWEGSLGFMAPKIPNIQLSQWSLPENNNVLFRLLNFTSGFCFEKETFARKVQVNMLFEICPAKPCPPLLLYIYIYIYTPTPPPQKKKKKNKKKQETLENWHTKTKKQNLPNPTTSNYQATALPPAGGPLAFKTLSRVGSSCCCCSWAAAVLVEGLGFGFGFGLALALGVESFQILVGTDGTTRAA